MRTHNLQVLGLGGESSPAEVTAFRDDVEEHGLAVFDDDLINPDLFKELGRRMDEFFARSLDDKRGYERPEIGRQRGYASPEIEFAEGMPAADLKEMWQHGPADADSDAVPLNVATDNGWFDHICDLIHLLLSERMFAVCGALAPLLEVPADRFINYTVGGDNMMRLIHYYDLKGFDVPAGAMRSGPHTDIDLFTLLKTQGEGLVVQTKSGREVELDIGPKQLIVQMGDMMEVLSGGRLPATKHWVLNKPGKRYSIALFCHPRPKQWVDVLPQFRSPDFAWDGCTERCFLEQRLIDIGFLNRPPCLAHERASQGFPVPSSWSDFSR